MYIFCPRHCTHTHTPTYKTHTHRHKLAQHLTLELIDFKIDYVDRFPLMSHFSLYNGKLEEKWKTLVGYFALTRSVHPVFTISATYQRLHIYLSMRGVTFLARVAIDQRHCTGFVDYHIMYMCIPWVFLTVFGLWVFRRHTFLLKSVCARREGGQS